MKSLQACHPFTSFLLPAVLLMGSMFFMHPAYVALSLAGGLFFCETLPRADKRREIYIAAFFLLLLSAFLNPLMNPRGSTIWFVVNDTPVTAEAFWYGVCMGGAIAAALVWCHALTILLRGDRLYALLGGLSPKLALCFSMILRFFPLYVRQAKEIRRTQTALGAWKCDNPLDRIRNGARVFSALTTWALENGIVTADSMECRGYGCCRRGRYTPYRIHWQDILLWILCVPPLFLQVWGSRQGWLSFEWYPIMTGAPIRGGAAVCVLAYGILCLLPGALQSGEALQWKYVQRHI